MWASAPTNANRYTGHGSAGGLLGTCKTATTSKFGRVMCRRGGSPTYTGHRPNRALSAFRFCKLPEPHRRGAPGPGPKPWLFLPGVLCKQRIPPPEAGPPKRRIAASAPRGLLAMTRRLIRLSSNSDDCTLRTKSHLSRFSTGRNGPSGGRFLPFPGPGREIVL